MTATLAKMEDMSLQHWLKDVVIPLKWVERVVDAPLEYNADKQRFDAQIVWLPNFLDEGRGWVFFDPAGTDQCVTTAIPTTEQTTRVTVKNEVGATIGSSLYSINYSEGAIVLPGGATSTVSGTPTTVDFTQYYVSVVNGWPGTEPPPLPVVAVCTEGFNKQGFQLGGGRKASRRGTLQIFATSSAERHDLTEFLYDALFNRHIPVLDFRDGEPLDYDGLYDDSWAGNILQLNDNDEALFHFRDVDATYITARQDWSEINRWRSKITFRMESFRDGLDFNALS